jgi:hypothetical protein
MQCLDYTITFARDKVTQNSFLGLANPNAPEPNQKLWLTNTSAVGYKQTSGVRASMSAFGGIADMGMDHWNPIPSASGPLHAIGLTSFIKLDLPKRETLLHPWLGERQAGARRDST